MLAHVLHGTGRARPAVVIDAGANRGEYTRLVLSTASRLGIAVRVHAFEPGPDAVTALRAVCAGHEDVRIEATGLADYSGEAVLYGGKGASTLASLVARPILAGTASVSIPVTRLDAYLKSAQLEHVDFLKIDVEGSELAALRGAGDYLRPEVIDAVQFEYGGTTLDARGSLAEIYQFLEERGYCIGKLMPREVEIRAYRPWMENFVFSTYTALHPRWCGEASG